MTESIAYVPVTAFARPPRVLVVAPGGDDWQKWAAAALRALGRHWGGPAGVVIPAEVALSPKLFHLIRRFQPDHVAAYAPTVETCADLGLFDVEAWASRQGEHQDRDLLIAEVRKEKARSPEITAAAEAAAHLRKSIGHLQYGGLRETQWLVDHPQFSDRSPSHLTPVPGGGENLRTGVPFADAAHSLDALAVAIRCGVVDAPPVDEGTASRFANASADDTDGRLQTLLAALHPADPDDRHFVFDLRAQGLTRVNRGYIKASLTVVGDTAFDFALAGLLRQIYGGAAWISDNSRLKHLLLVNAYSNHQANELWVTSASMPQSDLESRLDEAAASQAVFESDGEKLQAVPLDDIDLAGRFTVAMSSEWDRRLHLPMREDRHASEALVGLDAHIPIGTDITRRSWIVTLVAAGRPLPPQLALSGEALDGTGTQYGQTFLAASDGGISHWSHRFDFVASGASVAGLLASPRLAWPRTERIVSLSIAPLKMQPGAAGRRTVFAENLLGTRAALEDLAAGPGWALFAKMLNKRSMKLAVKNAAAGTVALDNGTVVSWDFVSSVEVENWKPDDRRAALDEWSETGILRRGLVLGCDSCSAVEFYPLDDVGQSFACRRCGGSNPLRKSAWKAKDEPTWYYELHPVIAEAVANDALVPLMATRALRRFAGGIDSCGEFEIHENGRSIVEVDFAVSTSDGLWLGEAKSTDSLGGRVADRKREVEKLINGWKVAGAEGIIYATIKPEWKESTIAVIRTALRELEDGGKVRPRVLLLEGASSAKPTLRSISGRSYFL